MSLNTKLVPSNGNQNLAVCVYSFLTSLIERAKHLGGQITTPRGVEGVNARSEFNKRFRHVIQLLELGPNNWTPLPELKHGQPKGKGRPPRHPNAGHSRVREHLPGRCFKKLSCI
jgi:hypothetical protein